MKKGGENQGGGVVVWIEAFGAKEIGSTPLGTMQLPKWGGGRYAIWISFSLAFDMASRSDSVEKTQRQKLFHMANYVE